jgi:hypothetical protein
LQIHARGGAGTRPLQDARLELLKERTAAASNAWPAWSYDWADLLAQADAERDQRKQTERAQNRTLILPTSVEIARMERPSGGRWFISVRIHS